MKKYIFIMLACWGACSLAAWGLSPADKALVDQLVESYNLWQHKKPPIDQKSNDDESYKRQEAYYALVKSTTAKAVKEYTSSGDSLLTALFAIDDMNVKGDCIWQAIRNITAQNINVNLKRDIVYKIMKIAINWNDGITNSNRCRFSTLLIHLPQKVYYNDDSIKLAEQFMLANKCNPALYDFFDLTKHPKVFALLKSKMESLSYATKLETGDEKYAWYCACVLARHGDKVAIEKIKVIAKNADKICSENNMAMAVISTGIAYTQQMQLIEMLFPMLESNISHFYGYDCLPGKGQLAHEAAFALSFSIKGFPKIDRWQDFTEKNKKECIDWINTHKTTLKILNKEYPDYIEKTIIGFSWIN